MQGTTVPGGAKQRTGPSLGADFGFSGWRLRVSARGGRRRLGAFRDRGRPVCAESMQRNSTILVAAVHHDPPASPAKSAVFCYAWSHPGVCSLRIPQQGGVVAFDMLNYKPISTLQSPYGLLLGAAEPLPWCQSCWPQTPQSRRVIVARVTCQCSQRLARIMAQGPVHRKRS